MGKASTPTQTQTTMMTTTMVTNPNPNPPKKKRGRPSLSDLQLRRNQQNPNHQIQNRNQIRTKNHPHFIPNPSGLNRRPRSARRTADLAAESSSGDGDDDERAEKKVKLVRRLEERENPPSPSPSHSSSSDSDHDDPDANAIDQDEKGWKATDTQNGTRMQADALDPGPTAATTTTPLPDKKLLLLILDKLQKKDTRGVFAEPVDPEELPDYHEVIEHPMDFATVRKKLKEGFYLILEQFEADIYLICSNAMEYNAPSTIYFRQARSIQELAKKEFDTLRQDDSNTEQPPKPRRGRPPGSRNKKPPESSSREPALPESPSDATPASREDDAPRSSSYNLRKGPSLYRFPRNFDYYYDSPVSTSRSFSVKYGKKQSGSEEGKRETYYEDDRFDSSQDLPSTFEANGNGRRLIAVGLDSNYGYARSLARFAADLGPVVWRIVTKKIRSIVPPGVEFGPGWVSENKGSLTHLSPVREKSTQLDFRPQDSSKSEPHRPSISGFSNPAFSKTPSPCSNDKVAEARGVSPSGEWSSVKYPNGMMGGTSPHPTQQGPFLSPGVNGFSGGGFAPNFQTSPEGMGRVNLSPFESAKASISSRVQSSPVDVYGAMNLENLVAAHGMPYWQNLSIQERWDRPYMAEPSVGSQASGSRSPSLQLGSSPQLDLVLQL